MKRLPMLPVVAILLTFSAEDALASPPLNELSESQIKSGWELLFDGSTTNGWRNYRADSVSEGWTIDDGVLSRTGKGAGDIITTDKFRDFELSLEYRISKGGNSGIMFHVTEEESTPWRTGPEVQVQDNIDGHDPQKSGWLYQLYKPAVPSWAKKTLRNAGLDAPDVVDATRPAGEWNQVYLRVCEQQSEVVLNGVRYYTFRKGDEKWDELVAASKFAEFPKFGKSKSGHICLQDHGNLVSYRNIMARRLNPDGTVLTQPIDGKLALKGELAFPDLEWEDWEPVDDRGRSRPMRIVELTTARDGSNRLFAVTQSGVIHAFDNNPAVKQSKVFLNVRDKVYDWKKANEAGLLGLAFHPHYEESGAFFIYYIDKSGKEAVLSRLQVSKEDADRADPDSETVLMRIPQPFLNHDGGSIEFGPDGFLYIGLGDGGLRNDPFGHGQNPGTWLGSILRIDVDQRHDGLPYGIPADNPFVDVADAKPEIYAIGIRNAWRLAFDKETGDLWIADVGQELWEEINIIRRGGNYGWSVREGAHLFGNVDADTGSELVEPIWEYDHRVGKSITGGRVYRSSRLPELTGKYLYADYVSGRVWALDYDRQAGKVRRNLEISDGGIPVLAFGEDQKGDVYYMTESASGKSVFRFVNRQ